MSSHGAAGHFSAVALSNYSASIPSSRAATRLQMHAQREYSIISSSPISPLVDANDDDAR